VLAIGSYWTFAHRMYHTWLELNKAKRQALGTEAMDAAPPHSDIRPERTLAAKTG
jgi:hypothetical protein